ncbi:MAG: hypothetical protein M3065_01430 [Actinomycetota bacterium]|nr:hypothetical protein [Actinomycetota bacterium]
MIRRFVLLASIASLALAPTGAAAGARELKLHFHPIGANPTNYTYTVSAPTGQTYQVGQIVSDGTRWIAFTTGQGQLRVYDSKIGRLSRPIAVDPRCGPTALGSGLVLIACIAGAEAQLPVPAPKVLDLAHDRLRTVPGAFVGYDQPDAIGRYWIAEEFCSPVGMAGCYLIYVNWRTGRTVNPITDEIGPRPNLSSRTLAPLRRPAYSLRPCDNATVLSYCAASTPLTLLAPKRRPMLLSRCSGKVGCNAPRLTPGSVTWRGIRDSYAYRIKDGARVTLTPSRSCGRDAGVGAIATLSQLVEVQCNGLYEARW